MTGPDPGWLEHLQAVRAAVRDVSDPDLQAARQEWDGHWQRWLAIARRAGRSLNQAVPIADTRTEAQYGKRPGTQPAEETEK